MSRKFAVLAVASMLAAAFATSDARAGVATVTTFAPGTLPEAIVPVPAGFGTLGGTYFVPSPGQGFTGPGVIYNIPAAGGAPSVSPTSPPCYQQAGFSSRTITARLPVNFWPWAEQGAVPDQAPWLR